jgi:hypothetical protein
MRCVPHRRDTRFVTELVAGVTRWRRRLDFVICHLTNLDGVAALDAPLRQVLRCARVGARVPCGAPYAGPLALACGVPWLAVV